MSKCCACRFLHGENTEQAVKAKIDAALEERTELKTQVDFYKKSGELNMHSISLFKSYVLLTLDLDLTSCPSLKRTELTRPFLQETFP